MRHLIFLAAFFFALGLAIYFILKKRRAAASLKGLLAERFTERALPLREIAVPTGGRILFHSAYQDKSGSGLILLLGNQAFEHSPGGAHLRLAGVFKPSGGSVWLERNRPMQDVVVASIVEGDALIVRKGLRSRESVLAMLAATR